MSVQSVLVHHRSGQWCPGVRNDSNVVAFDMRILDHLQVPGRPVIERCFLLLDEGVQITQPVLFKDALEGGWYVDLVHVETPSADRIIVHDLYLDLLIPPRTQHYEVLDLDELADAIDDGAIDLTTATTVLRNAQRFVDRHLRNLDDTPQRRWPDFPPRAIFELAQLPPF